jgi:outer membrane protein
MRNKTQLIALVLFALTFTSTCAQSREETKELLELTLTEVWQKADSYSRAIKMQRLNVEKSEQLVKDARTERLPELSIAGYIEKATNIPVYQEGLFNEPIQHEVIHTLYKIGADSYFNIYNGSKTTLKIKEEETLHKIATEKQNLTISEVRLLTAKFYLELQKNYIFKDLMIKDIEDQEKQLAEIREFLKNGVVLKSDVLRAELKLSQQKMALVTIENDILLANQKLNIMIGEPDERPVKPIEKIDPESLQLMSYDDYLLEAMEKSFPYRISEQETHLREIELKQVKGNVAPKIGLYGDFYFANPQIFLFPYNPYLYSLGVAGIRASFPVSSFYHNKHKEKAARYELHRQETEHSDTEDQVRKQVKEAYLRFKESLVRIDVAKVNIEQAKENFRIVNNTYFNQTSLITDLLDADIQLLQTQFDLEAAKIGAQLQYFQLQNIIGNL